MTLQSSYQPFLIGQGTQKTGLFSYLESWVKPEDAYDTLINAYVYRGSLYQREGMFPFPSANGNGALLYQDNFIAATGTGADGPYSGTLTNIPLIRTATITALTASGTRSSTATFAAGNVAWSTGGSALATAGTINFTTGVWSITTSANVANNVPIVIQYTYVPTSLASPENNPIMGIKQWVNDSTNATTLVVCDTERLSYYNTMNKSFDPVSAFQQILYVFPLSNATIDTTPILTQWTNIAPSSVSITVFRKDGTIFDTATDIPTSSTAGNFSVGTNGHISGGAILYNTGSFQVTFNAGGANLPPDASYIVITGSLQGDYFTGDNTNFFNATNWRTSDTQPSYLYLTNNKDFVTLFTFIGVSPNQLPFLARPPFGIVSTDFTTGTGGALLYPIVQQIATTLDVKVYQNRLIFIRPTEYVNGAALTTPEAQSIFWSQSTTVPTVETGTNFVNLNFAQDLKGNGGFLQIASSDWLMAGQFIRNSLVVFAQNSTWIFLPTGSGTDPFRFNILNNSRSTNAPYGTIEYDAYATSMGSKGLIACDAVSVERYDESIIDQFTDINPTFFGQCFAQKFDTLNQSWMLYPSKVGGNTTSNNAIIYNFLEKTWALFQPNLGLLSVDSSTSNTLSCLGLGFTVTDYTWNSFAVGSPEFDGLGQTWSQATYPWNSFLQQNLAPTLLGGDQLGYVYVMNDGPTDTTGLGSANGIPTQVQTKRLNPFIQNGEKARFGYLDVYYEVNPQVQMTFNFYVNNSDNIDKSQIFTFDGPGNNPGSNQWNWKRIYLNMVGEFIQIEINSLIQPIPSQDPFYNTTGVFKILGMILYAAPAGRLTPGLFL